MSGMMVRDKLLVNEVTRVCLYTHIHTFWHTHCCAADDGKFLTAHVLFFVVSKLFILTSAGALLFRKHCFC